MKINQIIKYNNKEYAQIIESKPDHFCDMCDFSELCQKVLYKKLEYEKSPMKMCSDSGETFSYFISTNKIIDY